MINFNEVTWYSKLAAIIFFIGVFPVLCFYIGNRYGEVKSLNNVQYSEGLVPARQQPSDCPNGTLVETLNGYQCDVSESETALNWRTYKNDQFEFQYPSEYGTPTYKVFGSSNEVYFDKNSFTVTDRLNYNNQTGKPYSLDELYDPSKDENGYSENAMIGGNPAVGYLTCGAYLEDSACLLRLVSLGKKGDSILTLSITFPLNTPDSEKDKIRQNFIKIIDTFRFTK